MDAVLHAAEGRVSSPAAGFTLDTGTLLSLDRPGEALLMQVRLEASDLDVALMTVGMARASG